MKNEAEYQPGLTDWLRKRKGAFGLLLSSVALTACISNIDASSPIPSGAPTPDVSPILQSGCAPFEIYVQNVWPANPKEVRETGATPIYGAAYRADPDPKSLRLGGYEGNTPLKADRWVRASEPMYSPNPSDRDGRIWYRVVKTTEPTDDPEIWVNNAAVRGQETKPDPELGYGADNGVPAPTPLECELK